MGAFGNKFRQAREKKQLSYEDVSRVTKIGSRMLRAIEEENFDLLPGGVFNKGFIRSYAKHLDLDPDEAVNEYLATVREAQLELQQAMLAAQPRSAGSQGPHFGAGKSDVKSKLPLGVNLPDLQLPRLEDTRAMKEPAIEPGSERSPSRLIVAAAVVIILGGLLWVRHVREGHTKEVTSRTATEHRAEPMAQTPTSANPPRAESFSAPPRGANADGTAANPQSALSTPVDAGSTGPADSPTTSSPLAVASEADVKTAAPNAIVRSPKVSAGSAATLSLLIRATETSWISVQADGQHVVQETLIAPAHTTVRADREIVVRVGNAAGINFLFNGVPVSAQGSESEGKTIVFDASGLKQPQ
jgi:cytoskeleton protein RodZ